MPKLDTLRDFVHEIEALFAGPVVGDALAEPAALAMRKLVAHDDWLPDAMAAADPVRYQQHLLYLDADARFSVVSFVWGPGQMTPIHNHTVWGVIGMLRGSETGQAYALTPDGIAARGPEQLLEAGEVEIVSPSHGDIHQVRNADADRTSISIHLYGGDIGAIRRSVFAPGSGAEKLFVSGYSQRLAPLFG